MSDKKPKTTDDLIESLSDSLAPVSPRCPYRRMSVWLVLSVVYILGIIWYLGLKVNIQEQLSSASFIYEMVMTVLILISAAIASSWLSFPDGLQRPWMKIIPLTLFGSFLVWIFANGVEESLTEGVNLIEAFYMESCSRGVIVEVIPFIALIVLTAKGNTTQPYWLMTMNIIAVSALGWVGLRLTCTMFDSMTYSFIHYMLPFTLIGFAVGLFARKLFKW